MPPVNINININISLTLITTQIYYTNRKTVTREIRHEIHGNSIIYNSVAMFPKSEIEQGKLI